MMWLVRCDLAERCELRQLMPLKCTLPPIADLFGARIVLNPQRAAKQYASKSSQPSLAIPPAVSWDNSRSVSRCAPGGHDSPLATGRRIQYLYPT